MFHLNALNAEPVHYVVDGIALIIMIIISVRAAKKGLIGCLFGFVSTIVSLLVAFFTTGSVVSLTGGLFGLQAAIGREATVLIAGVVLFFASKLLLRVLRKILTAVIDKIPLVGSLNHILGFVVGILEAALIVSGLLALVSLLPIDEISAFLDSTILLKAFYYNNPIDLIIDALAAA